MKITKTLPCSLCILVSAVVFAADNTDAVMMNASPCLDIISSIERLACFEEQANAAQGRGTSIPQQNLPVVSIPGNTRQQPAQSPPQAPPQAPPQVEPRPAFEIQQEVAQEAESDSIPPADSVENSFGLPEEKEEAQVIELIARVAELKELGLNRYLITLENGQVWEQMQTRRFALSEGDEVRIYPTRWGSSYRLSSQSHKGYIQVQRLR